MFQKSDIIIILTMMITWITFTHDMQNQSRISLKEWFSRSSNREHFSSLVCNCHHHLRHGIKEKDRDLLTYFVVIVLEMLKTVAKVGQSAEWVSISDIFPFSSDVNTICFLCFWFSFAILSMKNTLSLYTSIICNGITREKRSWVGIRLFHFDSFAVK